MENGNLTGKEQDILSDIEKNFERVKFLSQAKKSRQEVEVTIRMMVDFEEYEPEEAVNFQGHLSTNYDMAELVKQFEQKIEDHYYENK